MPEITAEPITVNDLIKPGTASGAVNLVLAEPVVITKKNKAKITTIPKSLTILGKSTTGHRCPFDTEETWGVNNVAEQSEFAGIVNALTITKPGKYVIPPVLKVEGDCRVPCEVVVSALTPDGGIGALDVRNSGVGYASTPKVIITGEGGGEIIATTTPLRKFHKLFAFDILEQQYTDRMSTYAPICSWQDYGDIEFPLDEVIKEFGSRYFTNTISYMLALAAYYKIPEIKIYGVDVTFGAPYAQENRGIEYWIGRAQERGCTVIVPDDSHLLRTVSGAMYGVKDACNVALYLHERINLINILPKSGTYSDALKAHNAWWVLFPKDDEAKAHNVVVNRDPAGNLSFQCPIEFLSDVHMPPEVWEYLRNRMRDLEKKGELNFGCISAYEKLVLSKETP